MNKRRRPPNARHTPVKSDPQDEKSVTDVVMIDQFFDHPNRDKYVRFRRQRRPLIPPLLTKPLEFFLAHKRLRRRFRARPKLRNFHQNQVPLTFKKKLERVFMDLKDLLSFD